jgi:hypothetical protein
MDALSEEISVAEDEDIVVGPEMFSGSFPMEPHPSSNTVANTTPCRNIPVSFRTRHASEQPRGRVAETGAQVQYLIPRLGRASQRMSLAYGVETVPYP